MEKENQIDPVDHPTNAGGNGGEKKDFVEYESFKKALDEKKRVQSQKEELESELKSFREADLKRKGKTDELLSEKDKRIAELESKVDKLGKNYTWSTLTGEVKREAISSGCKNPDKLIKLMSDDDLRELSQNINEDFTIDQSTLKNVIEKNKKENFFLFESSNKTIVNGNPNKKPIEEIKGKDLGKLSLEELKELHKKSYK
jgi:hypothetical protein